MRSTGGSRRDAPWCVSAPSRRSGSPQPLNEPARVPEKSRNDNHRGGAKTGCNPIGGYIFAQLFVAAADRDTNDDTTAASH